MKRRNDTVDSGSKPRQLIVGCDGTNNTLTGGSHDTNVLKLISQLVPADGNQILYYDPGVGSPDQVPSLGFMNELTRKRERIAGMARGKGIYENIAEAYMFLVENHEPGDQIYIFGFSRGAFTARCVSGMINLFGIIRAESKTLILTLIRVYFSTPSDNAINTAGRWARQTAIRAEHHRQRNQYIASKTGMAADPTPQDVLEYLSMKKPRKSTRREVAEQVRNEFTTPHGKTAAVHFIGVWDTVESVGILVLSRRSITSDGTTMKKNGLRHVRHALSMDEHRLSFTPRLYWDEDYWIEDEEDPSNTRSLRQRWFRGAHSDVGGGYDVNEAGLSDHAYRWMLAEAIACGLRTAPKDESPVHVRKPYIAHDACFDTPWWGVAGLTLRTNVTHAGSGHTGRIRVIPEGAAAEQDPRMYSVWDSGAHHPAGRLWAAVACVIVFWMLCGWLGYAAFFADGAQGPFTQAWQGAAQLEIWQKTYAWDALLALMHRQTLPYPGAPAVWAAVFDFALIAAYSWLLGLYGSWSFMEMAGLRHPQEKVSPLFKLGYAPMVAVLADIVENLLTIVTLWCFSHGLTKWSIAFGVLMMLANLVKWLGFLASLALIACGTVARARKLPPLSARPARDSVY